MFLARRFIAAGVLALLAGTAADANAQQIYRIVGPDGRITFADKPPAEPGALTTTAVVEGVPGSGGGTNLAGLPFELRQAVGRYPVTLYSAPGCTTCAQARSMLMARGIPFAEKVVSTNEDVEAYKRLGASTMPMLTIGGQQLKGFSDSEWSQFLDAAGYPKTSQLPPSYVPSPATPLVAASDAPRPAATPVSQTASPPAAQPRQPAGENPAGIQF